MKRAVLFLAIGAVSLFSCNNDDDESLPDAPVAVFDASVNGAAVTLTNSSTGTIDSYAWDFGDGTTSTQKSPGPKSYTKTGEYTITLTVTNKGGSDKASKKVNVTVAVADTEAPVITLNGNLGADFDIQLGADYQDAGATATDNVDGTLTVTVGGDMVNTNEAGTYVITYDVSDAAGNAATRVTRTVRVRYPSGLVTNGDFQGSSTSPWFVNFPDAGNTANNTVPTETAATNTFFNAANITADANGQAFTVNLSQVIQIEQGKTYQLSFDASSDMNRSIIAGIGLNGGSFASSTQNVNITTTTTRYMLNLAANFVEMGTDNRVLFDLAGEDGTVVLDNIALAEVTPTEMPSTALSAPTDAPTDPPMRDAANVISIYGEAYGAATGLSNVTWDGSTAFAEETIAGNKVLKVNFDTFLGTSLGSKVDASGMSHFHMDFWIADDFAAGQVFNPKWSNHAGGNVETSAFEYTKAIGATETKKWVAIDIPITDFATGNNSQRGELAQFLITVAGLIDVAYIDNIYFYDDGTGGNNGGGSNGGGGEAAAPTDAPTAPPVRNAANVISIYGEAYGAATGLSNVPWDGSTAFAEETIAGNKVLKVNFDTFLGTSLDSKVDASGMSHFHMDFWITDDFAAGQVFNPKWSNHAGGNVETSAFEYTKAIGATETKKWVAIDIPITDFATGDNSQRGELAQFLITVAGKIDVAYIDNIYFYNAN